MKMGDRFSSSGLEIYTRRIKDYPILSREEESELAGKYKEGDKEAGKKIVTANLRFVLKISQSYFHIGYRPLEIIQEGNMGLVKAITMFDPDKGVRFICYAIWWIKAYIKNYIYRSYQTKTGTLSHAKGLISLDCNLSRDPDEEYNLLDLMLDETPDQEHAYVCKEHQIFLMNIISSEAGILSNREIFVLKERFFADATLKDIASRIGVTRQRVMQIEAKSLQRIRKVIETKHAMLFDDIFDSTTLKMKHGRA